MNASTHRTIHTGVFFSLYYNARSLLPIVDELRALTLTHKPHLICIIESWLDSNITDREILIENYDIIRWDRKRQGGSVMFFVITSLSYDILFSGLPDLEFTVFNFKSSVFLSL